MEHCWAERVLLDECLRDTGSSQSTPIFILGAPRTGSTLLYQMLVAEFQLPFISNFTNTYYCSKPIIGLCLQAGCKPQPPIHARSRYGKTEGLWQPSEASAVMRHWFGGEHPSELLSSRAIPAREPQLRATLLAVQHLFKRPLVVKNAWNCFRLRYLSDVLPGCAFIWIRRDITSAALSDLAARYAVHGKPTTWNSASPRNLAELLRLPYWEQVVEWQFEYSRSIFEASRSLDPARFMEIWYEDLCADPHGALKRAMNECRPLRQFGLSGAASGMIESGTTTSERRLSSSDVAAVCSYVQMQGQRLHNMRYGSR